MATRCWRDSGAASDHCKHVFSGLGLYGGKFPPNSLFLLPGGPLVSMAIQLVTLLPGAIPIGYGHRGARKGFARTHQARDIPVVVKECPVAEELAAELFCARLGRHLGFAVPEPVLVFDPETKSLLAGSQDVGYPNLLQMLDIDPKQATPEQLIAVAKRLVRWSGFTAVATFDEWIHNIDRNFQNLLWDGHDMFVLIDHGRSLGVVAGPDQNILLMYAIHPDVTAPQNLQALKQAVMKSTESLSLESAMASARDLAETPLALAPACSEMFTQFLHARRPQMPQLLMRRFPPSPQLGLDFQGNQ